MKKILIFVGCLFFWSWDISFGKNKEFLDVRVLSYRIVPYETTGFSYIPARDGTTDCYGGGSDNGGYLSVSLHCRTVDPVPATSFSWTEQHVQIYNQVETPSVAYTITCLQKEGRRCSWLTPQETYHAYVKGETMWIEAWFDSKKKGKSGKMEKVKFKIVDIQSVLHTPGDEPSPPTIEGGNTGGSVFMPGGVSMPQCLENCSLKPHYSEEGYKLKIQGTVLLQMMVRADGSTDSFKVLRGLGYGLDEAAIDTVRKWRFRPGYKNGRAVDVYAQVEVNFRL